MKFCFGNHDYVIVEAKDKDHAIKIFKVSELFPSSSIFEYEYYRKLYTLFLYMLSKQYIIF